MNQDLTPFCIILHSAIDALCLKGPHESRHDPILPNSTFAIDVQFTNHATHGMEARAEPVLPSGWRGTDNADKTTAHVEPGRDGAVRTWIQAPSNTLPGRYVIPFRVTCNAGPAISRYLGQFRHAIVVVW